MAKYDHLAAEIDGGDIRVQFELDAPGIVGWQFFDPSTGAYLFEGPWKEIHDTKVALDVALPEEDGAYRLHVAPVEDRDRFILIDAKRASGRVEISPPRVTTTR